MKGARERTPYRCTSGRIPSEPRVNVQSGGRRWDTVLTLGPGGRTRKRSVFHWSVESRPLRLVSVNGHRVSTGRPRPPVTVTHVPGVVPSFVGTGPGQVGSEPGEYGVFDRVSRGSPVTPTTLSLETYNTSCEYDTQTRLRIPRLLPRNSPTETARAQPRSLDTSLFRL